MRTAIHKQTYTDGRAYRYHISDEDGCLRYLAEPAGLLLPSPIRLVEFFDPDHNLVGRLQPPDGAWWRREKRYEIFVGGETCEETEEPYAVVRERLRLVDMLLLRLPRYEVQLAGDCYVIRGSRYGRRFYEILRPRGGGKEQVEEREPGEMKVGQIQRPAVGPSYIVETDDALLSKALLVLAALVVLIDVELFY